MPWGWKWIWEFFDKDTNEESVIYDDKTHPTIEEAKASGRNIAHTVEHETVKGLPTKRVMGEQSIVLVDDDTYDGRRTILPKHRRN